MLITVVGVIILAHIASMKASTESDEKSQTIVSEHAMQGNECVLIFSAVEENGLGG